MNHQKMIIGVAVAAAVVAVAVTLVVTQKPPEPRGLKPNFAVGCAIDDVVVECVQGAKLVIELAPNGYEHFAAVMVHPSGTEQWIYPRAEGGSSLDLRSVASNGVMNDAIKLDGPPGEYLVKGAFAHAPMDRATAKEAVAQTDSFEASTVKINLP